MKKQHISKTKKKFSPLYLLVAALIFVGLALILLRFSGIGAAPGSHGLKGIVGKTQLMQNAKVVKQDLKDIAELLKTNDVEQLENSGQKLDADVAELSRYMSRPIWSVAEIVPGLGRDVKTAKALVEVSEVFSGDLLPSWIELQKQAPYTGLKTEDGYDSEKAELYLDYLDAKLPTLVSIVSQLDTLDLRLVDEDGKITAVVREAKPLLAFAEEHFTDTVRPAAEFLLAHPSSSLKTEKGLDPAMVGQYYNFILEHLSSAKELAALASRADLSLLDKDGKLSAYAKLAQPVLQIAERYADNLLTPAVALLAEHPLSEINKDNDINFDELREWSDFLYVKSAVAESFVKELRGIDLSGLARAEEIGASLATAEQLLQFGLPVNAELLRPALQMLKERPLSSLIVDGGYDVRVILAYLDYIEQNFPKIEALSEKLQTLDLGQLDRDGKVEEYRVKLANLQEQIAKYKDLIPAVRVVLGDGETDRLYFFPAQNSSEIRASGGFPGNAATIKIENGILTIGKFKSGYSMLSKQTPRAAQITKQEVRLFTERMYAPRDVDFCIDFERVASIWAMSVNEKKGYEVDGVITATPVFIHKVLAVFDEPITLSNGMTLDGKTATRVLQRDLYFEYKRDGMDINPDDDMTDKMFAETIVKTLEMMGANFDSSHVVDYIRIFQECIEERIIMLWMADEEEQEIMRKAGWSGSLNSDPEDPKLGIFFSSEQSSKMGYFFDMIPEVGEPVVNEDGSRTYDVTLTLNNVITKEEQKIGGTWILGRGYVGSVVGDLTLTAPAGGTITDIQMNIKRGMRQENYNGLDTHYVQWLIIERQTPIVVNFKVTTAPGVDAPLGIMATPTLTNYRA